MWSRLRLKPCLSHYTCTHTPELVSLQIIPRQWLQRTLPFKACLVKIRAYLWKEGPVSKQCSEREIICRKFIIEIGFSDCIGNFSPAFTVSSCSLFLCTQHCPMGAISSRGSLLSGYFLTVYILGNGKELSWGCSRGLLRWDKGGEETWKASPISAGWLVPLPGCPFPSCRGWKQNCLLYYNLWVQIARGEQEGNLPQMLPVSGRQNRAEVPDTEGEMMSCLLRLWKSLLLDSKVCAGQEKAREIGQAPQQMSEKMNDPFLLQRLFSRSFSCTPNKTFLQNLVFLHITFLQITLLSVPISLSQLIISYYRYYIFKILFIFILF